MFRYAAECPEDSDAALLEREFAQSVGVKFALGLNSCSSAILLALKCCGVVAGDQVLMPAFTFTAVPGAIVNLGALPVLVECNANYRIDIEDLRRKINPDTKVLLLSHMRGHISDLDTIVELCRDHGITLIEDAAHSHGGLWRGKATGSFGLVGCFSFQSYKMINSGEGGMLTTDDEEIAARAIRLSGCYENLYSAHFTTGVLVEKGIGSDPPYNFRMSNLTAAIVRSQLKLVEARGEQYRKMYGYLTSKLARCSRIELPEEDEREQRIPDSIQFRVRGFSTAEMKQFAEKVRSAGLPLSAIDIDQDNARAFWNWTYLGGPPDLPQTRASLRNVCDMRLAYSLTTDHLDYIADTILDALR
ncbi:MAG TPA: aminotransferase class I/II-fold pyridoxal phosphate-dependent enzyme [Bryobacteraceae bacterium]|nr:aminotransferase class I/II-fold pyridoxal phosphate-dependent enzyme [Bryobacteraceae bacterium]